MDVDRNDNNVTFLGYAAIKYGAILIGLIVVLFFMARHLFPFLRTLF